MSNDSDIFSVLGGRVLTNVRMLPDALRQNRPNREDSDVAAEVIEQLLQMRDTWLGGVRRLPLNPGDKLVVTHPAILSREQCDWLKAQMSAAFPEQPGVVVLSHGMTLHVLGAPDVAARPTP